MDDWHIRELKDQIEIARHYGQRVSVSSDSGKLIFGYVADTSPTGFTITENGTTQSLEYSDVLMLDTMDAER